MAFNDSAYISKEKHELDYVLRKWQKRTTAANRALLAKALDDFKTDADYEPHDREKFYAYAEERRVKDNLESALDADKAAIGDSDKVEEKPAFPAWLWWLLIILLLILIAWMLRSCVVQQNVAEPRSPVPTIASASAGPAVKSAPSNSGAEKMATAASAAPIAAEGALVSDSGVSAAVESLGQDAAVLTKELKRLDAASVPKELSAFRFQADSFDSLVPGEERRLAELAVALAPYGSGTLVLTGHSASIAYPEGELLVSRERAAYLARRLAEAGLAPSITVETYGQGAASPVSADELDMARALSRRVELSVK